MHVPNILWMAFGIGLMLVLSLKFKVSSMVTLLVAALSIGMLAGTDLMSLLHTMKAGFGNTLGELTIIVAFDAVIGKLVIDSGAAHQIAYTLLVRPGLRYVQILMITVGPISGLAMFYEVTFIMLTLLVIIITAEAKVPFLKLAIPAIMATTIAYPLFPPQPGPVALVNVYGVDMGMVYIYGVLVAIPNVTCAGLVLPKFFGNLERSTPSFLKTDQLVGMNNLPSFGVSVPMPLIPAIIMIFTTIANIWLARDTPAWGVVDSIGSLPIAVSIATVAASVLLGTARGHDMQWVMNVSENTVKGIAVMILIIGAGGVLKQTTIGTGIGDTIDMLMSYGSISSYIMAWLITILIRLATRQGMVSAMTAAGIIGAAILDSAIGQLVGANPALLVLVTATGSNTLTHINNVSFWLSKGYFDLSVKDMLKTWRLPELVNFMAGLIIVLIISMVA